METVFADNDVIEILSLPNRSVLTIATVSPTVCCLMIQEYTGADLGFSERGGNHSSGSLKQGVWGCSPPEAMGYFIL